MSRKLVIITLLSVFLILTGLLVRNQQAQSLTLFVGPVTVPCPDQGSDRCLQIKYHPDEIYQSFSGTIIGFEHMVGYESNLTVSVQENSNLSTNTDVLTYALETIISQEPVPYLTITTPLDSDRVSTPLIVSGNGRGLFEGNVVVNAHSENGQLLGQAVTTMLVANMGDEGQWTAQIEIELTHDTQATLTATSPSPKDGGLDLNYQTPVLISAKTGINTLETTRWLLSKYSIGSSLKLATYPATAIFTIDQVTGNAGCNNYFAVYQVGSNNSISISGTGANLKRCEEPVMAQETALLTLLPESRAYTIENNRLILFDINDIPLLVFTST